MSAPAPCPVHETILRVRGEIESGRLAHPRSRRIAEEILDLLNDVAWGRAGQDHPGAIASLADELAADTEHPAAPGLALSLIHI